MCAVVGSGTLEVKSNISVCDECAITMFVFPDWSHQTNSCADVGETQTGPSTERLKSLLLIPRHIFGVWNRSEKSRSSNSISPGFWLISFWTDSVNPCSVLQCFSTSQLCHDCSWFLRSVPALGDGAFGGWVRLPSLTSPTRFRPQTTCLFIPSLTFILVTVNRGEMLQRPQANWCVPATVPHSSSSSWHVLTEYQSPVPG